MRTERMPTRISAIEPYRALLGTVPDSEIAAMARVSPDAVLKFRNRRGIAGFAPPGTSPLDGQRRRTSKLAAHLDIVGVLSDAEVARRVGMTAVGVLLYRQRHGIRAAAAAARPAPVAKSKVPVALAVAAVAMARAPVAARVTRAFHVTARRGDESRRFVAVGADICEAVRIAVAALAARTDGPWHIRKVSDVTETLVIPAGA